MLTAEQHQCMLLWLTGMMMMSFSNVSNWRRVVNFRPSRGRRGKTREKWWPDSPSASTA